MQDAHEPQESTSLIRRVESYLKGIPCLYGTRSRLIAEVKYFRHALRSGLWRQIVRRKTGTDTIPTQKPLVWKAAFSIEPGKRDLKSVLVERGIQFQEGRHTIYVAPQPGLSEKLGDFVAAYPAGSGFKFLKNLEGPKDVKYIVADARQCSTSLIVGSPTNLMSSAGFMASEGLCPVVYDLAQVSAGEVDMTMFVVQHVEGVSPTEAEWREFIEKVRRLIDSKQIVVCHPDWEQHRDFACPDCSDNLLRDAEGRLSYVDIQNFFLPDLRKHLRRITEEAKETVHFGASYLLRPRRYLYQQIPGMESRGKRDTHLRWERLKGLLASQDVRVNDRVVLDIGCNTGMMLAEALSEGAFWGVGWDMPEVVGHTRRLLSALGYSRFTLGGRRLATETPIEEDLPEHVRSRLDESIVFYLAIRHHIGFIDALGRIPWKTLVYEGPEEEFGEKLEEIILQLQAVVPCEVLASEQNWDGDCVERPVLIIRRTES